MLFRQRFLDGYRGRVRLRGAACPEWQRHGRTAAAQLAGDERRRLPAILVFAGGREGYLFALDARSGTLLWKSMVGGQVASGPITYAVDGRQSVAISAGNNLFVYALRR